MYYFFKEQRIQQSIPYLIWLSFLALTLTRYYFDFNSTNMVTINHNLSSLCIDDPHVIDVVILWVNGSDPEWIDRMYNAQRKRGFSISKNFIRDRYIQHDELKYAFRSIEKFTPWVHKIHLITDNQIPNWLTTEHPKVQITPHSFLFYPGYHTFNSNNIQFSLYKIPGIARRIILMDDDTIFLHKVEPQELFDEDAKTLPHGWVTSINQTQLKNIKQRIANCPPTKTNSYVIGLQKANVFLIEKYHSKHWFHPYHVQISIDMKLYFRMLSEPEISSQMMPGKIFRGCEDYQLHTLYFGYSSIFNRTNGKKISHMVIFTTSQYNRIYNRKVYPKLFCYNVDNESFYRDILNPVLPKSSFEI